MKKKIKAEKVRSYINNDDIKTVDNLIKFYKKAHPVYLIISLLILISLLIFLSPIYYKKIDFYNYYISGVGFCYLFCSLLFLFVFSTLAKRAKVFLKVLYKIKDKKQRVWVIRDVIDHTFILRHKGVVFINGRYYVMRYKDWDKYDKGMYIEYKYHKVNHWLKWCCGMELNLIFPIKLLKK